MGLLDYYRQFEGMTDEEVSARAARRGRRAPPQGARARRAARPLAHDLARATRRPTVVNAITYAARRGLHRYLDAHAPSCARELGAPPRRRRPSGSSSATAPRSCSSSAAQALLEPGDELITPWPSYPLYPLMARRARGKRRPGARASASTRSSRAVTDAHARRRDLQPQRPDRRAACRSPSCGALLDALPERVVVLLDEALRDFVDAEPLDATLDAARGPPARCSSSARFSKAWGLAGLRCGYAIGGPGAEPLLDRARARRSASASSPRPARSRRCASARRTVERRTPRGRRRARAPARPRCAERRPRRRAEPGEHRCGSRAPGIDGAELAARLARARRRSSARADRSASPSTSARRSTTARRRDRCCARSSERWRRAAPSDARLGGLPRRCSTFSDADWRSSVAGRLLEDLAPGARLLLLAREVLDDLAHARGGDLDAVAPGDLLVGARSPRRAAA